MRRSRRPWAAPVAFASLLALSGCGGGDNGAAAVAFKPLSYDYLTKLRLNVGDIRIEDQTPPATGSSDLAAQAPTPPAQAMRQMATDRLVAAGNTGTAVFTIDQAAITGQPGGTLDGALAAHLDIIGASGGHNGYAEAHVSRQLVPGSDTANAGLKSQLYDLTNQMMSDMNVELEYQLRRTLGDWLLDASGAPVGATVEQQSLGPAATAPAAAAPSMATLPSAAPTTAAPPDQPAPATAATPSNSTSVGAPTQLAPPAEPAAQTDAPASGPTQIAPPPQTPPPSPATTPAPAAASPPPGFLRLPNGYLAPAGSAPQNPAPQATGPLNLAPPATGQTASPNGY